MVALTDFGGAIVARYTYDAWGKLLTVTDGAGNDVSGNSNHIANVNPVRYRSYVYDTESGFYYLTSRYYDPTIGRFINADAAISGLGGEILGYNVFACCFNNPVNMKDNTGLWPNWNDIKSNLNKGIAWVEGNILQPLIDLFDDVAEDFENYDSNNQSEEVVFSSNYFSNYKGALVIKTPFDASFSFGLIRLSTRQQDSNSLKHEYGHFVQLKNMGIIDYTRNVAIPSVTINILERQNKLKYDYFGAPWEAEADMLGGVNRTSNNTPWPEGAYNSYYDLIEMF